MNEPHGVRSTYQRGCRCLLCRSANAAYRPSGGARLVGALEARSHLLALQGQGIGVRRVAELSGVSAEWVYRVRAGLLSVVRSDTAARLLAVKPLPALGALVPSWPCRRLLVHLGREGFTRAELAARFRIPRRTPAGRPVRAETAARVRAVHAREIGVDSPEAVLGPHTS